MTFPSTPDQAAPATGARAEGASRRALLAGADATAALTVAAATPAQASRPTTTSGIAWPHVSRPRDLSRIPHWSAAELSVAIRCRVEVSVAGGV